MFREMLFYHSILIYLTVGFLILGGLIPFLIQNYTKVVKLMRMYMFFIHTLFVMVAFSGLVAFAFAKLSFNLSIFNMIVIYLAVTASESVMYLRVLKAEDMKVVKLTTLKYTLINLLLMSAMIIYMENSAVPL